MTEQGFNPRLVSMAGQIHVVPAAIRRQKNYVGLQGAPLPASLPRETGGTGSDQDGNSWCRAKRLAWQKHRSSAR